MAPWLMAAIGGVAGGLVASLAMNLYQGAAGSLFGQGGGNDDPATVKAADDVKRATGAPPVTQKRRATAGSLVHYATGAVLGLVYGLLVAVWPPAAFGFGVAFGIVVALVLDDLVVPALGWGSWPWRTTLATNLYGLSSHAVFGAVLEGVRRLAVAALG
jgi:hypothetical protein